MCEVVCIALTVIAKNSACNCVTRFTRVSGMCVSCVEGKYKYVWGDAPCTSCKASKYFPAVGAISVSACLPCGSGTFSVAVGASFSNLCVSCETGKYAEIEGGVHGLYSVCCRQVL